jgi:hypothetical protein
MDRLLVIWQGVDTAHEIPDNVSRFGGPLSRAQSLRKDWYRAYKAPRRSLLCWSIFFLASSLCVLRFSFAIYSFQELAVVDTAAIPNRW